MDQSDDKATAPSSTKSGASTVLAPTRHKTPLLLRVPAHIQAGMDRMSADAVRPFPTSYQRLLTKNIAVIRDLREAGATWRQVAQLLGSIHLPIRQTCLRAMVSRAERVLRDAEKRRAAASADTLASEIRGHARLVASDPPSEMRQNELPPDEGRGSAPRRNETKRNETKRNEAQHFVATGFGDMQRAAALPEALRARAARIDFKPRTR